MAKEEFDKKTFIDRKGYFVWKDSGDLVHRTTAYKQIYLKDRKKYPLDFSDYQVHHKDKVKTHNWVENLELKERVEHEKEHKIIRREHLEIIYMKIMVFAFLGIMGVEELSKRVEISGVVKGLMFLAVFLIVLSLALLFSREKKGHKYI